jgi:osmotically-inducible protein OsmY
METDAARKLYEQIACAATACLLNNCYKAFGAVSCSCQKNVLVLQGQTSTFYFKQVAQESVRRVDGVVQVVNEIDVPPLENEEP